MTELIIQPDTLAYVTLLGRAGGQAIVGGPSSGDHLRIGGSIVYVKAPTDGSDATAAIQAAWNAATTHQILYHPYGTYLVTNLTIPSTTGLVLCGPGIIKAKTGGNVNYLIASYKYINNVAEADVPIEIRGLHIDGNSIVTNPLVVQNWDSIIEENEIYGGVNGLKITTQTLNTTDFSASTLVNNRILKNKIHNCTGKGLYILDTSRNKATDYDIIGNIIYTCGDGGYLETCAGHLISGNHFYDNTRDAFFSIGSLGLRILGNHFEGADSIRFEDFNINGSVAFGGNVVNGMVYLYMSATGDGAFNSTGNTFRTANGCLHNEWNPNVVIYSTGDAFETSTPYRTNNPSATSKFFAKNSISTGIGKHRLLDGLQYGSYLRRTIEYAAAAPSATGHFFGDKVVNNDATTGEWSGWVCIVDETTWKGFGAIE